MKLLNLIKKHFRNVNLLDWYLENYYREQIRNKYTSIFCDLNQSCLSEKKYIKNELIISLTTYGARAHTVYLTITSLIHQTIKANRIVLWLSESEFNESNIPITLSKLKEKGLDIRFCPDIKSFKKIIPSIKAFPNADIITVDDDIIYPADFVERMVSSHIENAGKVCFTRGCNITLDDNGYVLPYKQWKKATNVNRTMMNIPTGVGGVFYPSGCFYKDVLREDLFMELCPKADDLWLRVMCLLNKVDTYYINCYENFAHYFIEIENSQITSLNSTNNADGTVTNDTQFKNLIDYFQLEQYIKELEHNRHL